MIITPLCQRIVVRYARKPIWMPTAPSKLFRIAEHTFYSPEEMKRIKEMHLDYTEKMAAIKDIMEKEFYIPATKSGGIPPEFIEKEYKQDEDIYRENDKINSEVAKMKEEYFTKLIRDMEDKVMEEKLDKEEELIETSQKVDEYVKKHKGDPDGFVTPENIDSMIQKALESPISHEFCIDRSGRRYGMSLKPQNQDNKVTKEVL